jgi:hypothetical protein
VDVRLGVSVVRPFRLAVPEQLGRSLRFHTPLIEPDVRISRIRLSDKRSCLRPRQVARRPRKLNQSPRIVENRSGKRLYPQP